MPIFEKRSVIPVPVNELFAYHARPGALERLIPPWLKVTLLQRGGIRDGEIVKFIKHGLHRFTWIAEHHGYVEGKEFSDRAIKSPFKSWDHHHRFSPDTDATSILQDTIEYEVPAHAFFMKNKIKRDLERMFRFRHARTLNDLVRHAQFRHLPRQIIAVTGATGLVAGNLIPFLTTAGHSVVPVARSAKNNDAIQWNPATGELKNYRRTDTFIHLAGKSVTARWTKKSKQEILDSRVSATEKLCRTLAALPDSQRPRRIIAASAIGFYGDRGEEVLTESSAPGTKGFFPQICTQWELATKPASDAGIQVVHLRIGVALTPQGGALAKLATPTKLGLAGPLGSGRQWFPWIAMEDLIGLIHHVAMQDQSRVINAVAPNPVRQREFARTFAKILRRPAVMPMPAFVVRMIFGQMGREAILASTRVIPENKPADFGFLYPDLEPALRAELAL
jgi:uncharacterized protein (TIGR01777 family)